MTFTQDEMSDPHMREVLDKVQDYQRYIVRAFLAAIYCPNNPHESTIVLMTGKPGNCMKQFDIMVIGGQEDTENLLTMGLKCVNDVKGEKDN